jgi:hypothetical protein
VRFDFVGHISRSDIAFARLEQKIASHDNASFESPIGKGDAGPGSAQDSPGGVDKSFRLRLLLGYDILSRPLRKLPNRRHFSSAAAQIGSQLIEKRPHARSHGCFSKRSLTLGIRFKKSSGLVPMARISGEGA